MCASFTPLITATVSCTGLAPDLSVLNETLERAPRRASHFSADFSNNLRIFVDFVFLDVRCIMIPLRLRNWSGVYP